MLSGGRVAGDLDFDDYVRLRGAALVRLAHLLTGDRHRGEDLVQDVLAKAFVRWDRIAGTTSPESYLRKMLVNASVTRWRRASNREVVSADTADLADARAARAGGGDPGAEAAERDAVWRLVRTLPAKQRAAVVLRYYEDLDDASIAALLNCSTGTVRSQVKRALDTLRGRMDTAVDLCATRRNS